MRIFMDTKDKIYEAYQKVLEKSSNMIKVDGKKYFVNANDKVITITHEKTGKKFIFDIDEIAELIIKKYNVSHKIKKSNRI